MTPVESKITFHVEASVAIDGTFDTWDAPLTFTSPAAESAVLASLQRLALIPSR
jgi:hypothetical protein